MRRLLTVVAALAVAIPAGCLPAAADPGAGRIGLSTDRASWAAHLASPLFDEGIRWVPGDTRTASFWVSNRAREAGALTISADRVAAASAVMVSLRVAGGDWVPVGEAISVRGGTLAPGADRRVDVRVTFDRSAGNDTQSRDFPATFRATLVQDAAAVDGAEDADDTGTAGDTGDGGSADTASGSLAATGADVSPRLLLAALGALGTGGVLLLAGRRRNDTKEDS